MGISGSPGQPGPPGPQVSISHENVYVIFTHFFMLGIYGTHCK